MLQKNINDCFNVHNIALIAPTQRAKQKNTINKEKNP